MRTEMHLYKIGIEEGCKRLIQLNFLDESIDCDQLRNPYLEPQELDAMTDGWTLVYRSRNLPQNVPGDVSESHPHDLHREIDDYSVEIPSNTPRVDYRPDDLDSLGFHVLVLCHITPRRAAWIPDRQASDLTRILQGNRPSWEENRRASWNETLIEDSKDYFRFVAAQGACGPTEHD